MKIETRDLEPASWPDLETGFRVVGNRGGGRERVRKVIAPPDAPRC